MNRQALGALAICVAAAAWGADGVLLTPRLFTLSVPFIVFLIHAIPFLLMQPLLFRSYGTLRRMDGKGWLALLLVATTGGLIGTLAIVKALFIVNFNHLSVVVLLQKLQPLFAIALAGLVLRERITSRFLAWAAGALLGAYLLTFGLAAPQLGGANLTAALWAVVAAASFGAATVFGKLLLGKLDFAAATFGRFGMTSLLALLYLVVAGVGFPFGGVTPANWLIIGIIAVTTGSSAIFLYYYGLTRVTASISTICELCLPLSALLLDWLVNGTILHTWQWVGAAILLGAIIRITSQGMGVTPSRTKR